MKYVSSRAAAFALAVLAALAVTVFSGCASGAMSRSVSPDDTLVVVPVVIVNLTPAHAQYMDVKYQVNIENVKTGSVESIDINASVSGGYRFKRGLPPGEYFIREYIPHGLVNASAVELNVQEHLVVESGKVTLFPLKPIITIRENSRRGGNGSVFYNEFREMETEQMDRIKDYLKASNPKAGWVFR